ncbi:hypothetical protein P3X46_028475 [Hevea brasiliensis]|uniref:Carboxypeptidase n=1 Tax=Hevea brasiliensis TaxID=3981 RepID=A0ABQ9KP40_HEVBR|nr:hypothetical protein P3X46_028475 [Hevea brasiliensis]
MDKGCGSCVTLSIMGFCEMGKCCFSGLLIALLYSTWLLSYGVERNPAKDLVFAGYIDVDVKNGRSIFYYFVEAKKNLEKKPLSIWLNGDQSSLPLSLSDGVTTLSKPMTIIIVIFLIGGGAFTELGSFFPSGDGRASNILFVESPAGVGWSYSNTASDYTTGDAKTTNDMYMFLSKSYEKFSEFKSRELFLTGESYAGHYIPQLAEVLLDHNARSTGFKFNIKGVAIDNPLVRLDQDVPATYELFWSHGMISDEIQFDDYTFSSPHNVTVSCNEALAKQIALLVIMFIFTIVQATKISVGVDMCMTLQRSFYFNLPEVPKALHVNRTNLLYRWSMCSGVLEYSDTDGNMDILPILKKIIKNHIPVWVFELGRDKDSVVPLLGSRTLVLELVGGRVTEYGSLLTFATVRGASHMVPFSQPSRALHLFSSFLRGRRLPSSTHIPNDN